MDVKFVNPFIESFRNVMGQLGFSDIKTGKLTVKEKKFSGTGVVITVGIIGQVTGNIAYVIDVENAKQIASKMMMGMPVEELDPMSRSALSELSNMLSANAATSFSNLGVLIDISPPSFFEGDNIEVTMSSEKSLCIQLVADGIAVDVNISFDKI